MVRDRFARFDGAGRRRILRLTFPGWRGCRLFDMVGVSKPAPCPKAYDGNTLRLHLLLNFELTASVADGATAERILDNSFMAKPSIQVWRHYMA